MATLQKQSGTDALALEFIVLTSARTRSPRRNFENDKPASMDARRFRQRDLDRSISQGRPGAPHSAFGGGARYLETIRAQKRDDVLVFPERPGKGLHHGAMLDVLDRMGEPTPN